MATSMVYVNRTVPGPCAATGADPVSVGGSAAIAGAETISNPAPAVVAPSAAITRLRTITAPARFKVAQSLDPPQRSRAHRPVRGTNLLVRLCLCHGLTP